MSAVKTANKLVKASKAKANTSAARVRAMRADAPANEAQLWSLVYSMAQASVQFWNGFLGLRSRDAALSDVQVNRWLDLIRAVSWVESKHGTYNGSQGQNGRVDTMQCADTRNSWWPELVIQSQNADRFVRGPGLSNYYAWQLPTAAASAPGFDADAAISKLADAMLGSGDPKFTKKHSYYWGVPLLIHKVNHAFAGDSTYQCGDLSTDRLTRGAGKYNASANADTYVVNIRAALALFGGLSTPTAMEEAAVSPTHALADLVQASTPAGHLPKPPVIDRPSPNYSSRQGNTIQYLILHNTDGSLQSALQTLTTAAGPHPVSAHYLVDRGPDIYQLVNDSEMAWHAGNKLINQQSIGIESVAWAQAPGMVAAQEASLIALARFVIDAYDIPMKNVLPHRRVRIGGTDCPGFIWPTDAQFDAWVKAKLFA
jgi:N-acetylmuramoyl-L-alanine amidase